VLAWPHVDPAAKTIAANNRLSRANEASAPSLCPVARLPRLGDAAQSVSHLRGRAQGPPAPWCGRDHSALRRALRAGRFARAAARPQDSRHLLRAITRAHGLEASGHEPLGTSRQPLERQPPPDGRLCPDTRLTEYAQRFLANRAAQGIDAGTVARQEIDLRRHLLPRFGTTKVREITRPAVRSFLLSKLGEDSGQGLREGAKQRKRKRLSPGSVRSIYHTLSAILSEALEERLLAAHPLRGLWEDAHQGRQEAGGREAEGAHLRPGRRVLGRGREARAGPLPLLQHPDALRRPAGRSARAHRGEDQRPRPLAEGGRADRAARRAQGDEDRRVAHRGRVEQAAGHPHVAVPRRGRAARRPLAVLPGVGTEPEREGRAARLQERATCDAALPQGGGLPTYFGLHALRHTYGSGLISQGVSPAYVQAQMGHASIQQTVDTYGSWFPPRVPGAVDALAESFAPRLGHSMDTRGTLAGVTES
jgi:integrase